MNHGLKNSVEVKMEFQQKDKCFNTPVSRCLTTVLFVSKSVESAPYKKRRKTGEVASGSDESKSCSALPCFLPSDDVFFATQKVLKTHRYKKLRKSVLLSFFQNITSRPVLPS